MQTTQKTIGGPYLTPWNKCAQISHVQRLQRRAHLDPGGGDDKLSLPDRCTRKIICEIRELKCNVLCFLPPAVREVAESDLKILVPVGSYVEVAEKQEQTLFKDLRREKDVRN